MILFARAIGLKVHLSRLGTVKDFLLKINSKVGRDGAGGERVGLQSSFLSKSGSNVAESVASRSIYSLPTIPSWLPVIIWQIPNISIFARAAKHTRHWGFHRLRWLRLLGWQFENFGANSISFQEEKKRWNSLKWSRKCQANPIPNSDFQGAGCL